MNDQPKNPVAKVLAPRFLTDVMTAAGLVAHGKQDKKFASRLADECSQIRAELFSVKPEQSTRAEQTPAVGVDVVIEDMKRTLCKLERALRAAGNIEWQPYHNARDRQLAAEFIKMADDAQQSIDFSKDFRV